MVRNATELAHRLCEAYTATALVPHFPVRAEIDDALLRLAGAIDAAVGVHDDAVSAAVLWQELRDLAATFNKVADEL